MSTDSQAVAPAESDPKNDLSNGLSSPPDSNNALKMDGTSDSELSDLEDNDEDIGEVVPDGWSAENNTGVPIFKPTMAQFKNFEAYVSSSSQTANWGASNLMRLHVDE